jgi:hypothetical protein
MFISFLYPILEGGAVTYESDQIMIYQLRVYLRQISPMIWRRLLVRSDSTIADLHYTLQIVMGWGDLHLHQFFIRGKRYGESRIGGTVFSDNPQLIPLSKFRFRLNERFLYEYNFLDEWQHEIRLEKQLPLEPKKSYPTCIGGARAAPPEDCGGSWAFMALRQKYDLWNIAERMIEIVENEDIEDCREELYEYQYWLRVNKFDHKAANLRSRGYATGNDEWRWQ